MQVCSETWPFVFALRNCGFLRNIRGWDRLLRFLFHPDRQKSYEFSIPFFGFTYVGSASSFIDWSALFYGAYERDLLKFAGTLLQSNNNPVVLDIGANAGHHSLYFARSC